MSGKTSTKDQILFMLKKKKHMTVTEMATELGITEMAVRRHLHTLEHDKIITSELIRKSMGRPLSVYRLAEKANKVFANHYQSFSLDILHALEAMDGKEKVNHLLKQHVSDLSGNYSKNLTQGDIKGKVKKLAEIQEQNGYIVELEEEEDGFSFRQYHCPVEQIAQHYPEICGYELDLFRDVLDHKEIKTSSCLVDGEVCCEFKIRTKHESS